jgi:hypothetical protein
MSTGLAVRPAETSFEEDFLDEDCLSQPALERVDAGLTKEMEEDAIRKSFDELASELEESTAGLGSTRRAVRDPAFVEILSLGDAAIPLVVDQLAHSSNRPLWLRMLGTFTSSPPGAGQDTIDEAAAAWIQWERGRLAS